MCRFRPAQNLASPWDGFATDCVVLARDYYGQVTVVYCRCWSPSRAGTAFLAAALLLASPVAAATPDEAPQAPPELTLTWRAPAECPNAGDVEAQFARLLGGVHRPPTTKHLDATATVQRTPGDTWTIRLATMLDGVPGQRTLEGDSCWTVASAAALILALTIDPNAAAEAPPPAVAPVASEPSSSPPSAALATTRVLPAVPAAAPRVFARTFAGLTVALLPQAALTLGVAAGLHLARWRAELSALGTEQRQQTTVDRPGAGGDFRLLAAAARACWDVRSSGRVVPRLCAGGEMERIAARGFGVASPGSGSATIGAAVVDGVIAWRIARHFELALDLSLAGRPYHPTFRLGNVGDVFAVPRLSWAMALSAGIDL